jgi:protocatechuate 3,4-dioxygenase beta subunit
VEEIMRDFDQNSITDAVLATFKNSPDPRFRQIMMALVKHMHDFAREVKLAPDEWIKAIMFLTAVGQKCSATRQEFILLSDTLGLSALVNIMNSRISDGATSSSLLGPFYMERSPKLKLGDNLTPGDTKGEAISLSGRILDTAGKPIPDAKVEIWQTNSEGYYDMQLYNDPNKADFRGVLRTDAQGRYFVRTVMPLGYKIPMDGPVGDMITTAKRGDSRPAHIHFLVATPGYDEVATALYVEGDQFINSDAVFGVSESLIAKVQPPAKDDPVDGKLRRIVFDLKLATARGAKGSGRVGADPSATLQHAN